MPWIQTITAARELLTNREGNCLESSVHPIRQQKPSHEDI